MDTTSMPLPTGPTAQGLAGGHPVLQPNLHLSPPARHRTHQPIRTGTSDKDVNKMWHCKTPRREHRQNILWHKSFRCFLRSVSQGNRNKNKNKQRGPNKIYKLLHRKGNHKTTTTTTTTNEMEENIFKWWDRQGLNLQNIQTNTTQQPNKKQNNPI